MIDLYNLHSRHVVELYNHTALDILSDSFSHLNLTSHRPVHPSCFPNAKTLLYTAGTARIVVIPSYKGQFIEF
jgi:hypothetical protein